MPEPNSLPIVQSSCRFLRSKEMFVQVGSEPTGPHSSSGNFWCVHTQTVVGPDGRFVTDHECSPDRMCFESI
jgi:hypothetical protein